METIRQYKFTKKEADIFAIYEAYQKYVQKRGDYRKYLPLRSDPRKAKNWQYFAAAYELVGQLPTFDPALFIEAQFRNVPKDKTVYPAQLKTKTALKNYEEHRESLKIKEDISSETVIMNSLASTYRFLIKWWETHNLKKDDYDSLFQKDEDSSISPGMYLCIQGLISKYFMAVSRHFLREWNSLDPDMKYEVIDPQALKEARVKIRLTDEAWIFVHNIFKKEVYDS